VGIFLANIITIDKMNSMQTRAGGKSVWHGVKLICPNSAIPNVPAQQAAAGRVLLCFQSRKCLPDLVGVAKKRDEHSGETECATSADIVIWVVNVSILTKGNGSQRNRDVSCGLTAALAIENAVDH